MTRKNRLDEISTLLLHVDDLVRDNLENATDEKCVKTAVILDLRRLGIMIDDLKRELPTKPIQDHIDNIRNVTERLDKALQTCMGSDKYHGGIGWVDATEIGESLDAIEASQHQHIPLQLTTGKWEVVNLFKSPSGTYHVMISNGERPIDGEGVTAYEAILDCSRKIKILYQIPN
jgi:hypothetical protein